MSKILNDCVLHLDVFCFDIFFLSYGSLDVIMVMVSILLIKCTFPLKKSKKKKFYLLETTFLKRQKEKRKVSAESLEVSN